MKIRILLAEDHPLLRQEIREVLSGDPDFEVVAETGSGAEAARLAARCRPDVAIIASDVREMNGVEAATHILARSPGVAVVILSLNDDERYVSQARRAGARGYVVKSQAADTLIDAVHRARRGDSRSATR